LHSSSNGKHPSHNGSSTNGTGKTVTHKWKTFARQEALRQG
jgi:hypothetical protein